MIVASTGESRESMGPVRELENEDRLPVDNVEEPDTVISAEDCSSARDFSTQTPDFLACKKLKEEKRLLHNKCIDLKNKIDSLAKEPTPKSSCGIQCNLTQLNDHEEGLGERIGESLEQQDDEYVNMEVEEDDEDTVDYDITEEEPESIPDDVDYHPYTDTETETETEDEEHMTGKRFNSSNYSTRTLSLSTLSSCPSCYCCSPSATPARLKTLL
ncbi:uncharacterized protein LOC116303837 [Actinia tenebrosa]|uniref:Uncharacterized protein LOC116303837 n=1 Tax=Actinia tenebrosa TaxID=6105 RepID=A0A6P8ISV0_ACTTE|nr:uncharacterized protein LOC116303837 [Actinia tenebrosa]